MKERKHGTGRKIIMGALAVLLFAAAGIFIYIQAYYHALPDIQEVFAQGGGEQIQVDALDAWITYGDTKSGRGFIFYPGAKVEEEAYGPLMREIAAEDFFCVLVRMPGRLAVLGSGAAEDVMSAYPEIEVWYLGGGIPWAEPWQRAMRRSTQRSCPGWRFWPLIPQSRFRRLCRCCLCMAAGTGC